MKNLVCGIVLSAGVATLGACVMYAPQGPAQTAANTAPPMPRGPVGQKPFIAHYEKGPGARWDQAEYSPPNFLYDSYGEVVAYDQFDRIGERVSAMPPVRLPPMMAAGRAPIPLAPVMAAAAPVSAAPMHAPSMMAAAAPSAAPRVNTQFASNTPGQIIRVAADGTEIIEIGNFPTVANADVQPYRRPVRTASRGWRRPASRTASAYRAHVQAPAPAPAPVPPPAAQSASR